MYRKGKAHVPPDVLSRRPCPNDCKTCARFDTNLEEVDIIHLHRQHTSLQQGDIIQAGRTAVFREHPWDSAALREAQMQDPDIRPVLGALEKGTLPPLQETAKESPACQYLFRHWKVLRIIKGVLYREWYPPKGTSWDQLITPRSLRQVILDAAHHPMPDAHTRRNKMIGYIRQKFWWPLMTSDVTIHLSTCRGCQNISNPQRQRAPLQIQTSGGPFSSLSIDWTGPLPVTKQQNKYLLTVVDKFTKWCQAIPVRDTTSESIARALIFHVFLLFGLPTEIRTDRGRAFEADLWQDIMRLYGIRHTKALPLHQQTQGDVERLHRTLKQHLRLMISRNQNDWDEKAQMYLAVYRNLPHSTTGISPAMLMLGRTPALGSELEYGTPYANAEVKSVGDYARKLRDQMLEMHEHARENLRLAAVNSKRYYDQKAITPTFQVGDLVWLHHPRKEKGLNRRLIPEWVGPYEIVKQLTEVVYQIKSVDPRKVPRKHRSNWVKTVHADRLRAVQGTRPHGPPPTPEKSALQQLDHQLNKEIVSPNLKGTRARKDNSRRVFPNLNVKLVSAAPFEPQNAGLCDRFKHPKERGTVEYPILLIKRTFEFLPLAW